MEYKIQKDVPEEQETSKITISIYERIKKGITNLRKDDILREEINILYDYRTGQWTGDDYFGDNNGYRHHIGEYFEIWFDLYQSGYDGDRIPYWVEVNVIKTDPTVDDRKLDLDDDKIPTYWEWKWGYDPNIWDDHVNLDPDIDGLENIEEYQMQKWLSNPFMQNIYVEVDGMEKGGIFDPPHIMWEESQQAAIDRFSEHNIQLLIDHGWPDSPKNGGGELLLHYQVTSDIHGMMLQFYKHHFPDERKGIFRYVVIGHGAGYSWPQNSNQYDTSHLGYNSKQMINPFRNPWHIPTQRAFRVHIGAMFMHEIGHTLGIMPYNIEGCDNLSYADGIPFISPAYKNYKQTWSQYYSVMNYYWTTNYDWLKKLLDYSDGSNGPPYDQNDWEYLYLPFFQTEANLIEDINMTTPGKDRIIFENYTIPINDNWEIDENLSKSNEFQVNYDNEIAISEPLSNGCEWIVIKEKTIKQNHSKIKIYAQPKIPELYDPYTKWSLIKEGHITQEGEIEFYSIQNIIDEIITIK
jgi:hypothetical protein